LIITQIAFDLRDDGIKNIRLRLQTDCFHLVLKRIKGNLSYFDFCWVI